MKYQAIMTDLRTQLTNIHRPELAARLLLAQTIEQDMTTAMTLAGQFVASQPVLVDIAKLTKQVVTSVEEYSQAFGVKLAFELEHFGEADIAPLTTTTFKVSPEALTGPFFTAAVDAKYASLIVEKLVQLSVMLGSDRPNTLIKITVDRQGNSAIVIRVSLPEFLNVPLIAGQMFTKDYGNLGEQSNVRFGSGLEGWIAQELARQLGFGLSIVHLPVGNMWGFQLVISKSDL